DAGLFEGATWVLTPTDDTDAGAYTLARSVVSSLGAEVVAIRPEDHDALVALVSHVPHLTAAALMQLAASGAEEHAALLRLAAGATLVSEIGVNVFDFETVHSSAGDRGVIVFLVDAASADLVRGALMARGYKPSVHPLT